MSYSNKKRFLVKAGRTDTAGGDGTGGNPTGAQAEAIAKSGSRRRERDDAIFLGDDRRRMRGIGSDDTDTATPLTGKANPFAPVDKMYAKLKSVLYHTYYPNSKTFKARKVKATNRSLLMLPEEHAAALAPTGILVNGEVLEGKEKKGDNIPGGNSDDEEAFRLELFEDLLERVGGTSETPAGGSAVKGSRPGTDSASPMNTPQLEGFSLPGGLSQSGRASPSGPTINRRKRPNVAAQQEIVSVILRHRERNKLRADRQMADVQSIEYRTISSMLSPIVRILSDLHKRAVGMHNEQTHSKRANAVKNDIFKLCDQLGLDPQPYVVTEGVTDTLDFQATADYLLTQKDTLTKMVLDREAQLNVKIEEINKMREALSEAPLPLVNTLAANSGTAPAGSSLSAPPTAYGSASPRASPGSSSLNPEEDGGTQMSPLRRASGRQRAGSNSSPVLLANNNSFSGSGLALDLPLSASTLRPTPDQIGVGRGGEQQGNPTEAPDLSSGALNYYSKLLDDAHSKKDSREEITRQLAADIIGLWREDGQIPSLNDPATLPIDRKILLLLKNNLVNVEGIMGVNQESLEALADRKQELVGAREDRIRTTMEMSRRLKLIEDRQYLLDLMKKFEAQASNPLRLFGTSVRLIKEERFRHSAYPRLLLIEAVIRSSLLLYHERHGRPFMYQGSNYLTLLDQELNTRSIPRDLFPMLKIRAKATLSSRLVDDAFKEGEDKRKEILRLEEEEKKRHEQAGGMSSMVSPLDSTTSSPAPVVDQKSALEILFGEDLHDDCLKGLESSIAAVIDDKAPDFARVVQLSTAVKDVLAERVVAMSTTLTAQEAVGGNNQDFGRPRSGARRQDGASPTSDTLDSPTHGRTIVKAHDVSDEEWVNRAMKSNGEKEMEQQGSRLQELGWRLPSDFRGSKEHVDKMLMRHKKSSQRAPVHPTASDRRKAQEKRSDQNSTKNKPANEEADDEDYALLLQQTQQQLSGGYYGSPRKGSPPRISQLARHKGYNARAGGSASSARQPRPPMPEDPEEPEPPRLSILKDPCTSRHNRGATCEETKATASAIGGQGTQFFRSAQATKQAKLVKDINARYGINDDKTKKSLEHRQEDENAKSLILNRHRRLGNLPTGVFSNPDSPSVVPKEQLVPAGTTRLLREGSTPRNPGGLTITATQLRNITQPSHSVRADETDSARKLARERDSAYRSHHNDWRQSGQQGSLNVAPSKHTYRTG